METSNPPTAAPLPFRQPRQWIRWLAVLLAAAGWYVSLQALRVSAGSTVVSPFVEALCGRGDEGGVDDCTSVLTSPQAYMQLSRGAEGPKIPVSTFGLAYFALVGLWYLFIGPPTPGRRGWHLLIALIVVAGVIKSLGYMGVMAWELHRWCSLCLTAHGLNGGLLLLTVLAFPWRKREWPGLPHPSGRLVGATLAAGGLAFVAHLALVYVMIAGTMLNERTAAYAKVLHDPAFIQWDFHRQPVATIPLLEDEYFAGAPTADTTVVVFSDFQCSHCERLHAILKDVSAKYGDRVRVAYRYYPQDPQCNANPRYRSGGHASACRAVRAAEAARVVGGDQTYARMRDLLYSRQSELPAVPYARQSDVQRRLFEEWAAELGLDVTAFSKTMDSAAIAARIQADIALADTLGITGIPVVYVNGKRLRNWSKPETWDVLLGGAGSAEPPRATSY